MTDVAERDRMIAAASPVRVRVRVTHTSTDSFCGLSPLWDRRAGWRGCCVGEEGGMGRGEEEKKTEKKKTLRPQPSLILN